MGTKQAEQKALVLAAEEFDHDNFSANHFFSIQDERIISKLIAHGPVLLQGGRGSGKSALLIEASQRLAPSKPESEVLGFYLTLRHLPLLRAEGRDYRRIICELLSRTMQKALRSYHITFPFISDLGMMQRALIETSSRLNRRIVIMFDDAAHIGREASLTDFFDLFRTLSSDVVSCKATIYPGVTSFGDRFDVYNDATVLDVVRDESQTSFNDQFANVLRSRFPEILKRPLTERLNHEVISSFLAKAVVGNMRAFIFACSQLEERTEEKSLGLVSLNEALIGLSNNYFWPLFEEVSPKLGKYRPLIGPAEQIANVLFLAVAKKGNRSVVVHKDHIARMAKAFEILEYVGFIAKKESSRSMKSGGRGSRYLMNLCVLLEQTRGSRLTSSLLHRWNAIDTSAVEIHSSNRGLTELLWPTLLEDSELQILKRSIRVLKKSKPYPYGLTPKLLETLYAAGIRTVGALESKSDDELGDLRNIGSAKIRRIRNVIGQAVWM